jgi:hypothetical protein
MELMMADRNDPAPAAQRGRRRVEQRVRAACDSLPGERNDLPAGALGGVPVDPQADENRDPPANAPTIPP